MTRLKPLFKIGKKLCFPDAPSSWIPRTVEAIQKKQECHRRKKDLSLPDFVLPLPPKLSSSTYEEGKEKEVIRRSYPYSHCYCYSGKNDSVVSTKDGFLWTNEYYYDMLDFMRTQISDYTEEDEEYFVLKKDDSFDVISLLSNTNDKGEGYLVRNNGDKVEVDSLRGKNIVVCCFHVPCFWLSNISNAIRGVITTCSHLNNGSGDNYEMVMVAKMRRNWANDEDAFNHFFSGFPTSWLAVPFSDMERRDHVCYSIGLRSGCDPRGLLVDPNQKVLLHRRIIGTNGFDDSPFSLVDDWCDQHTWWETHSQLDSILDCDYVYKINNNSNDGHSKVSISELKDKVVGLYLCYDGTLIRTLDMVSQECKARNKEFHIVLVHLPYQNSVNPLLFQEAINHVLHNLKVSTNWWISPFNDLVSCRLWEVNYNPAEDQLIILDPHMNVVDPFAIKVIDCFGIDSYPFTREFLVRRELEAVRAVTIESLLSYGSRDHVLRINDDDNSKTDQVPIAELRGKNVLLYIDQVEKLSQKYDTLLEWYNWAKTASVADFEVVFLHASPGSSPRPRPSWLMCPFDPKHVSYVTRKIFNNRLGSLTAFDKDGHIITLDALDLLDAYGPKGFPLYNGLRNEVTGKFMYYNIDMEDVFEV